MLSNFEYSIRTNEDIDKFSITNDNKINSLQLDLKGGVVDKTKFIDFFEKKLFLAKNLEKLELDLTKYEVDKQSIETINKFFKESENLKELSLHISETKLSDDYFDKLMNDSLKGKTSIKRLHLVMENVNMTDNKRKSIEKLVKSMPNLNYIHINIQRNQLTQSDICDLDKLIFHFPNRVFLW